MMRRFNVTGSCDPKLHYMVDISGRLKEIKELIDRGDYFTINRARQYGKTTTIDALTEYLKDDYLVVSLDFQEIGDEEFKDARIFSHAFSEYFLSTIQAGNHLDLLDTTVVQELERSSEDIQSFSLRKLFMLLSRLCQSARKQIVLIIDEVDSATNNQVFLDFLAQLRSYYLKRNKRSTFQSVILAGVYDVKNIKMKIRPDDDHKANSPWNIAADFRVDMSFNNEDIKGMLEQYENDHHTGMNIDMIAGGIYDYTSGYPFLVSCLCQIIDERIAGSDKFPALSDAWTKEGIFTAVNTVISEKNTLFDSLTGKLTEYPELKEMLSSILFEGKDYPYVATNHSIEIATMLGLVYNECNVVRITNRIFGIVLYNHLLSEQIMNSQMYESALINKHHFIQDISSI